MRLGTSLFLVAGLIGCGQSGNNNGGTAGQGGSRSSSNVASSASGGATGGSSVGGNSSGSGGGSGGLSSASADSGGSKTSSGGSTVQTGGAGGTSTLTSTGTTGGRTGTSGTSAGTSASGGVAGRTGGSTSTGTGGASAAGGSGGRTSSATTGNSGGTKDGGAPDGTSTGVTGEGSYIPDPGWACGMADGIPSPKQGQLVFSVTLQISATHDVGNTPYGHRRLLDVKGGTITGDRLKGSVVTGGLEYELVLSNGVVEYQGINILKTSDGAMIYVRSCGVAPDGNSQPRVIPDFEAATSGNDAWLNTAKLVAIRVASAGSIQLEFYDVSKATVGEPRVQITKPAGVPKQPWDCNKTTGTKGATVLTESVSLGGSFSINGKRGSRNVIPITGGTTTGKVAGAILSGGADYQNSGSLDAWYTLAPSNGEFILVRNCGPTGKLIPWFEAKTDGEFNFLNTNAYLSSDPGMSGGGVGITFYERK
jgi:hypothetical protein